MKVAIIMGSRSDYPVVERTEKTLDAFDVAYETRILSAHRTPGAAATFASDAEKNGFEVIIAAAGKAAHLAGVMAAHTALPVIGLPVKSSTMDGLDSLLSTVQMPKGVPVATVAIDGAENAGLLAVQMLSLRYERLGKAIRDYKARTEKEILESDEAFRAEKERREAANGGEHDGKTR